MHMGASKQAVAQGEGNELPPLANDCAQEHLVLKILTVQTVFHFIYINIAFVTTISSNFHCV